MINIFYISKRGVHVMQTTAYNEVANKKIVQLFKQCTEAVAKDMDGNVVGEVRKMDGKWNYYFSEQLTATWSRTTGSTL